VEKIASFTVNHDILQKGMYVSRIDGDVVTYDIRMKRPNQGDYLPTAAMHTIEHLFATYARNSEHKDSVLYVGPMGCRTGFYLLVRASVSPENAIALVQASMRYIAAFDGEIPGNTSRECGNYLEHDLPKPKAVAADMVNILQGWTANDLAYKES
jgi:S-ribosylhomocysteine lyase